MLVADLCGVQVIFHSVQALNEAKPATIQTAPVGGLSRFPGGVHWPGSPIGA